MISSAGAADEIWQATGSMAFGRYYHKATLLANGKVLVTGGGSSSELYDSATGLWSTTGSTTRNPSTLTLLSNGKVLVTYDSLIPTELYDSETGLWSTTGSMTTARVHHTATLLTNGKVLVTGGGDSSAELYDPMTGLWSTTGSTTTVRQGDKAIMLDSGKVLVMCGGASIELYDPTTGLWSTNGSGYNHSISTATLLANGKVLVTTGGAKTTELFDPATGLWTPTGSMGDARHAYTATLLANGKVLVAGGYIYYGYYPIFFASAELYDPKTGLWSSTGSMAYSRRDHTTTPLANGRVLVAGGCDYNNAWSSAEIYSYSASLSLTPLTHGTISGNAASYSFNSTATLTATPDLGYVFDSWTGDASGSSNPLTITMDNDKSIGARFSPDTRDNDGDGLSNFAELVTYTTDPEVADSDGDGFSDAFEVSTGFDPKSATSTPDAASSIRTAVELRFNAAPGASYRIEESFDLSNWSTTETDIIGQGGVVTRFYSTENKPKRFFRVRQN